jgi:DnaB-like helicase C terminal domain
VAKTTFALNELDHQADQGYVCMLYCLEMDTRELAQKEVASVAKIDMSPYSGKDLEEKIAYEKAKFEEYKAGCVITKERNRARLAKNGGRLLFGYNRVTKMDEVFATMEAAHRRYGVDIFAFDNLQYLVDNIRGDRNANRAERLSQATKRFKSFAMEKKVAILLIMQPKKLLDGMMATSNDIDGTGAAEKDVVPACATPRFLWARGIPARVAASQGDPSASNIRSSRSCVVSITYASRIFSSIAISRSPMTSSTFLVLGFGWPLRIAACITQKPLHR